MTSSDSMTGPKPWSHHDHYDHHRHRLNLPVIAFKTLIDLEHASLVSQIRSLYSSLSLASFSSRSALITLLIYLIRHDFSEELVMRPAFRRFLGSTTGDEMGERDRREHIDIKTKMLALLDDEDQQSVLRKLEAIVVDLDDHMREESRVQLVAFEKVISAEEGLELGRDYAITLALGPDVVVPERDSEYRNDGGISRERTWEKCFGGGVTEYLTADVERMKSVLERLLAAAETGVDNGYLSRRVEEEIKRLKEHEGKMRLKI